MQPLTNCRWLRFSLRWALIITTVIAVWLGLRASSAGRQRSAIAAVQAFGGGVTYDYQAATWKFDPHAVPHGASWLRVLLGPDWFDTVHGVGLYDANGAPDDEIAAALRGVPETRSLQLDRSKAGAATLAAIGRMTSLRNLMMYRTAVDDPSLAHLTKLTRPSSDIGCVLIRTLCDA
jgi:hypothetical protein